MLDPHDDTDVPSGSTDGAQMESTSSPVPRLHLGASTSYNYNYQLPADAQNTPSRSKQVSSARQRR